MDSPKTKVKRFWSTFKDYIIDSTATGSVDEIRDPKINDPFKSPS